MTTTRKQYSAKFKARVAIEAIRGEKTLNQLGSHYGVHPVQVAQWRRAALEQLEEIFVDGRRRKGRGEGVEKEALYEEIGRLKVDLDWVKKLACSDEGREWVEPEHARLSLRRQCELLGINRASLYYEAVGERAENLRLMQRIDEQYTRCPFYGSRRLTAWLRGQGFEVNRKRVARLMRVMGLEAAYPKPHLSRPGEGHKIYPYQLQEVKIERVNQVWSTDITYIRLVQGFVYLVAVMDWFSRYVLSWALSVTLEVDFCLQALRGALRRGRPEIFNSDQGSQFTSPRFTGELEARSITISMDGRGRCLDNIFIERLWRTLKYAEDYGTVEQARESIGRYFEFYNQRRLHQSLGYRTPAEVHAL